MSRRLLCLVARAEAPTETFIRREMAGLRARGWTIDVLSLDHLPPRLAATPPSLSANWPLLRRALDYTREPRQLLAMLRRLPWLERALHQTRRFAPHLIQAHFAWMTADLGALLASASGVPFVCSVHGWDVFAQSPRTLRRRLLPARAVIGCSQAACTSVAAAGIASACTHLIRHGLSLEDYPFPPPLPGEARRLIGVGRLVPKKGTDTLLTAFAQLAAEFPELRLDIVGDGPLRGALEAQAAALGVASRVTFHGLLEEAATRTLIGRSAVLALPSRRLPDGDRDGIANVLLEAMALGTPVVTTAAGAAGELLRDGENGLLVPPDAPAALATALRRLLAAAAPWRTALTTAARRTVERDYNANTTLALLDATLTVLFTP